MILVFISFYLFIFSDFHYKSIVHICIVHSVSTTTQKSDGSHRSNGLSSLLCLIFPLPSRIFFFIIQSPEDMYSTMYTFWAFNEAKSPHNITPRVMHYQWPLLKSRNQKATYNHGLLWSINPARGHIGLLIFRYASDELHHINLFALMTS